MKFVFSKNITSRILESCKIKLKQLYCHHSNYNILESVNDYFKNNMPLPKFNKNYASVEVIGSGAYGAPASVFICAGNQCYLFNCGEGTQRICIEFKRRIGRVPNVFITYPSWKNCGGLLGMSLSFQSSSLKNFYIHGHSALETLFFATNKFVNLNKINAHIVECLPGKEFHDGFITINYVHLYKFLDDVNKNKSESDLISSSPNSFNERHQEIPGNSENVKIDYDDDVDYYSHLKHSHKQKHKKRRSHSEAPKKRSFTNKEYALSYICRTPDFKGSLLIEKCVDLNVPHGPLLGKLKNGEDVVLEDGTLIKSSEVTTPVVPGVVVIVVECPCEAYLDSLLKESAFYRHQTGEISSDDIASVVVHFTAAEVVQNPKYQEWINRFPQTTKHLYVNEDNKSLGLSAVYRQQYKLNMLLPDLFPILKTPSYPPLFSEQSKADAEEEINEGHTIVRILDEEDYLYKDFLNSHKVNEKTCFACNSNNHIKGESLSYLPIVPPKDYDYYYSSTFDQKFFNQEALNSEGFADGLEKFKSYLKVLKKTTESNGSEYPKVLFLGTGSSQPNKRRNASGILVFVNKNTNVLLDCGEGTFSQIIRFFGAHKAQEILMNLSAIYVSHMHVDHHLGLISILRERAECFRKVAALDSRENNDEASSHSSSKNSHIKYQKVFLLAPIQINKWLNVYSRDFENILKYINIIPNSSLTSNNVNESIENCLEKTNLKSIRTTLVDHCANAFGVALEHEEGWKITYSGDTKPCQDLIELGRNSDLLIHEATMEDSMVDDANRKLHSTMSQAIQIGKKMDAKFTILTHFSQRYAHIPFFDVVLDDSVGIAFDNLMVSLSQLPYLALLNNFLKLLYYEQYEKLEEKSKLYKELKGKRVLSPNEFKETDVVRKKNKTV